MSSIKLFKTDGVVTELPASSVTLERELQKLIEQNMSTFFGVTFLKTEYITSNGGRIDSIGIDENYCPVIFEYKRTATENVINQGLFYLDWLLEHKADFELIVMNLLGKNYSDKLDWRMPRLICVAGDFTKYDEHAVKQIDRNIDLIRYKKFGLELLLLELINSNTTKALTDNSENHLLRQSDKKAFEKQLQSTNKSFRELYNAIKDYILALGDDVTENPLKLYTAFKKMKNIICVEISQKQITLYLKLNPDDIEIKEGFTRDMRNVWHWGTGDLQVIIRNADDFEKAKYLIDMAYNKN